VSRHLEERVAQITVRRKALGRLQQPAIELTFERAKVGGQFAVIALWIVDEEARMHFEELRQEPTRGRRQMARAVLDLGEVRLAEARARLAVNRARHFGLRQRPAEAAEGAFDGPKVAKFLAQSHMSYSNIIISFSNLCQ
jgi:hypothetical protein